MANSYEIAQMFSQQNQMFSGQNQYAQSIGIPAPPVMGQVGMGGPGLAGYGMGGQGRGGGGFNYGQSGMMGYGAGNSLSAGIMSGAGAAFSGGSMALGAAGMFGMLGKVGGLMDPIGMGMGAARAVGGGLMGAAAGTGVGALMIGGGMALSHGVQSFVGGGQQQAQMNTMLGSQYNFNNPMSRTGAGFTRDDAKSIGDMTRQMAHLPEMMTSFEELSKIMGRLKGTGMMQGVRSAAEFQSRFKEAISTIRETAKVLGTTMEEAEQFFTSSRQSGFYNKSSQMKNVISAQFTSGVTGATVGQVAGLQQAGADMATSFGARRGLGATAVTNMAQNIGLAQASGNLREGAVEDATGMQGPEAQLAMAQKMFGGMMRFGQTAPGRLAMAGMMKFEGDKAVGVDEQMAKRFNQGLISVDELKARASGLTDKQKISYTARQSDLIASLAGQIGPGGAYGMMKGVLGEGRGEEATNLVMQRLTGMSAGEVDIAQGMQGVSGEGEAGSMARMRQKQSTRKERTDPGAVWQRLKTSLHAKTFGKLEQLGADVQTSIAKEIDSFFDDVVGREVSTLTEERAKTISQAFSGGSGGEGRKLIENMTKLDSKGLTKAGSQRTFGLGASMGLAAMGPVGMGILGVGMMKDFAAGGGFKGMIPGLPGGVMSEDDERAVAAKAFGTTSGSAQAKIADLYSRGKVAGSGAESIVEQIRASKDFQGKSAAEQAQMLSAGVETRTKDAMEKLGLGKGDIKEAMSGKHMDWLERQVESSKLGAEDKGVLRAFISAQKGKVGGDVFAQIAAASGGDQVYSKLAGAGGLGSMSELQAGLKSSQSNLSDTIGKTAAGFIGGGEQKQKAFQEAINNPAVTKALQDGDIAKARTLLMGKDIKISDADAAGLREAVNDYKGVKRDQAEANKAIESYNSYSKAVATKEFLSNMASRGVGLMQGAGGGKAGDAQRKLGEALSKFGEVKSKEDYDKAQSAYNSAFSDYSQTLKGLSGKDLEKALSEGGADAAQAYGASKTADKYKGKVFKDISEAAKALGVAENDSDLSTAFKPGKALSKDALEKIALKGAQGHALVNAQGGPSGPSEKSESRQMLEALQKMNGNQAQIATILAAIAKDKLSSGEYSALVKEAADADKEGKTKLVGGS